MSLRTLYPAEQERLRGHALTYPEVGATLAGERPAGYRHLRRTAVLGLGDPGFARAAAAVLGWELPDPFVVEQHDDRRVELVIIAFSRPGRQLTRLAGPVARLLQARVTRRYLRALPAAQWET